MKRIGLTCLLVSAVLFGAAAGAPSVRVPLDVVTVAGDAPRSLQYRPEHRLRRAFDSKLYALGPVSGKVRRSFRTTDDMLAA